MPKAEEKKTRPDLTDDLEWLVWVDMQPENKGIEVKTMYRKMLAWCANKGVTPTRRRLLRWLDNEREDVPVQYIPPNFDPATGTEICDKCNGTTRIIVNDYNSPCPKCKPAEEKAFWRSRGK